jgi:formate--tetrahydrofolate ligase
MIMTFKSDIEIAQSVKLTDIREIAAKLGLSEDDIDLYGKYKAKVDYNLLKEKPQKKAKLILTTAITPTPAGEGKTTTTIGAADALSRLGKKNHGSLKRAVPGPGVWY